MNYKSEIKVSGLKPVLSPRSSLNAYLQDVDQMKTNLIINIDKEILSLFKNQFEENGCKMSLVEFLEVGRKNLKSWQKDLPERQSRLIKYLTSIFEEIQDQKDGKISWENFNNVVIQKALNLRSLQAQENTMVSLLKPTQWNVGKNRLTTPAQKIVCIPKLNKVACLCEESNTIQFFSLNSNQHNFKPLILEKQELIVEKILNRRVKQQSQGQYSLTVKQNYKKDVVVADYKIIFLNMIYIDTPKYEMLFTSSSDGMVRGWNISGSTPFVAKQPENDDEKMAHHFPVEVHCMAWDEVNEVLYCSGKNNKIYLWLIKTDSERELHDPQAHGDMISSMIMMAKLQFLATGGYDGKLILWDTISLTKKFKYEEHTRSIVSMTFHEGLILLFTAAFDHSICVWNPYIPSLIYKIPCNVNVIQIQIIPNTNYIAALDISSTVKIREINKFNLISAYAVDRSDDQSNKLKADEKEHNNRIEPACMELSDDPPRFFFGGSSIKCLDFDQYETITTSDYCPNHLKYIKEKMQIMVAVKNNIQIWDILTGQIHDSFMRQTENQISALEIIENSGSFLVGDVDGSVYLRKIQNGIKLIKLFQNKSKSPVTHLLSRKGGLWNESVIVIGCQDGEIYVFGKDDSNDYLHLRTLVPKIADSYLSVESLEYEAKRNLLMVGSSGGEIIFMDVDKNKITNILKTGGKQLIKFSLKLSIPMLVSFNKGYEVYGVFLPPHSKKFKSACELSGETKNRISSIVPSQTSNRYFIGCENGTIERVSIPESILSGENAEESSQTIYSEWSICLNDIIKDMVLIDNESFLVVIQGLKNLTFINTATGEIMNCLNCHAMPSQQTCISPLCYYKQQTQQFYVHEERRFLPLKKELEQPNSQFQIHHNPYFLYNLFLYKMGIQNSKPSNPNWKVNIKFQNNVEENLNKLLKLKKDLEVYQSKPRKRRVRVTQYQSLHESKVTNHLEKAMEIQKKWQTTKEEEDMTKTKTKKLLSQSFYKTQMKKVQRLQSKDVKQKKSRHKNLEKIESSPMIRLGFALQRVDQKDQKAIKFIQMGEKILSDEKKSLKLPKLK